MAQQDAPHTRSQIHFFGGLFPKDAIAEERGIVEERSRAALSGGVGLGEGWANLPSGSFRTQNAADLIDYEVVNNAVSPDVVEFNLVIGHTTSGWPKVIIMPDGLGSSWEIKAHGTGGSSSNGLWADQVRNGQVLTFRRQLGPFAIWFDVVQIGFLGDLDPGDRVIFTWRMD